MEVLKLLKLTFGLFFVAITLCCALTSNGHNGLIVDQDFLQTKYGQWVVCVADDCKSYVEGINLPEHFIKLMKAARAFYCICYIAAVLTLGTYLILLLFEPELISYTLLAIAFSTAMFVFLLIADICALKAYEKIHDNGVHSYGWSLIIPWMGGGPALGAIVTSVLLHLRAHTMKPDADFKK